eukprot:XP_001693841.1 predicted protein [Chlamydomonas reinhardtii]
MSRLGTLNLGFNALVSTVPASWGSGMTNLTRIILTNNTALCGLLPFAPGHVTVTLLNTGLNASCPGPPPPPPPPPSMASGLVALKDAATQWPLTDWGTGDYCSWTGVVCDGAAVAVDVSDSSIQVGALRGRAQACRG